jgi:TonB family protein
MLFRQRIEARVGNLRTCDLQVNTILTLYSMMHVPKFVLAFPCILLVFVVQVCGQQVDTPSQAPSLAEPAYPDSAEGLRSLLNHVLAVAKAENSGTELAGIIKEMEIPDYEKWAVATYGDERGERSAESYPKTLESDESDLAEKFGRCAKQNGAFFVQKVEEGSQSPGGFDSDFLHNVKQPADAFYAEWRPSASSQSPNADPIGYFLFIDGKFRWDTSIRFFKLQALPRTLKPPPAADTNQTRSRPPDSSLAAQRVFIPGAQGVSYPKCAYCPAAEYPKKLRKTNAEGTVLLKVIVQPDGRATDIQVVKSAGPDFDKQAIEAVSKWLFHPALGPNGEPVPVQQSIDVSFHTY